MKNKKPIYYYGMIILQFLVFNSYAQERTGYIQPFEQNLSVRLNLTKPFLGLNQHISGKTYKFRPNNPLRVGIGISIKNTLIDFNLGSKFNFLRDKEKGKTESFDFQIHHYGKSYLIDLAIQKYHGFYTENHLKQEIRLHPNLEIFQYD